MINANENIFNLDSYNYNLPPENIAQFPANPRDSSNLLFWNVENNIINFDNKFYDVTKYLRPNDLLILNNTKVIPARLLGRRSGGGHAEIFLLRALDENKNNFKNFKWEALVKPARKIKAGSIIKINDREIKILSELPDGMRIIEFMNFKNNIDVMEFINISGKTPLPPYIKESEAENNFNARESYQTVFAKYYGSVAAPTASLHFTEELLNKILNIGVKISYVTLHVGLGTFRPVKVQDIREHEIHSEHCELSEETLNEIIKCKNSGGRVIASGTTAARTLETFKYNSGICDTKLFIYPGYKFEIVDGLITNFHLPESSLLMLVSAFASYKSGVNDHEKYLKKLLGIYDRAINLNWRFFSFGDAMLII